MRTDSSPTPVPAPPSAPAGMVEWSRTAANFLKAVARAYPHGAPTEVQALADQLWSLASRAATLAGLLETKSKAFEQLVEAGRALRAHIEEKIEELAKEESAESRKHVDELRSQLERYDEALKEDLLGGRQHIETRVREALECEKTFTETSRVLVQHLRDKPACREVLEEIAKGPPETALHDGRRPTTD